MLTAVVGLAVVWQRGSRRGCLGCGGCEWELVVSHFISVSASIGQCCRRVHKELGNRRGVVVDELYSQRE